MEKGIVIIHTGNGKGKSTAAFGQSLRKLGWNKKVCIIQYLKSPEFETGERNFFREASVEIHTMGIGFTWKHTEKEQLCALESAWKLTVEKLGDESYSLVVLDEILGVFSLDFIKNSDVITEDNLISVLNARPKHLDVILTGRGASSKMIAYADLATEMRLIKHPFEQGIPARKGMEY